MNCSVCDRPAQVKLNEGRMNILEVLTLKGNTVHDWTGGGSVTTHFCKECFQGLAKQIYREGYYADYTLKRDE